VQTESVVEAPSKEKERMDAKEREIVIACARFRATLDCASKKYEKLLREGRVNRASQLVLGIEKILEL
jgi:hypothetical protein